MIDSWRKNEKNKSLSDLSALDVVRCYHSESYNRKSPFIRQKRAAKVARFYVLKKETSNDRRRYKVRGAGSGNGYPYFLYVGEMETDQKRSAAAGQV